MSFPFLLKELQVLHDTKRRDYGRPLDPYANLRASADWGIPAWIGALVRATDKLRRLQTFAQRGILVNESVEDSLLDLAVYVLIALELYREGIAAPGPEEGTRGAGHPPHQVSDE